MNPDPASNEEHLFDELKRYVGFGAEDEARLRALGPRARPRLAAIAEDFYAVIDRHPGARKVFRDEAQVQRLKTTLVGWMEGLFTGPWDLAYYERRARIGRRHVEIGLPQQYMFSSLDLIRRHFVDVALATASSPEDLRAELHALEKIMDVELAIMLHTYREDHLAQMQRTERLATFGQFVASIGHELRNPLGVMQSSLFLLRGRVPQEERVVRHLDKIEDQIRLSNRIITDLLALARDRPAKPDVVRLRALVDDALEAAPPPQGVTLELSVGDDLPEAWADPDQVRQILVNLLANAYDAVLGHGPCSAGTVRLAGALSDDTLTLLVNDSGPGIDPRVAARLFEPLVTTKVHGVGLGLALCRKLSEANQGSITRTSGPLPGAAFEVRLPRYAPHGPRGQGRAP